MTKINNLMPVSRVTFFLSQSVFVYCHELQWLMWVIRLRQDFSRFLHSSISTGVDLSKILGEENQNIEGAKGGNNW